MNVFIFTEVQPTAVFERIEPVVFQNIPNQAIPMVRRTGTIEDIIIFTSKFYIHIEDSHILLRCFSI